MSNEKLEAAGAIEAAAIAPVFPGAELPPLAAAGALADQASITPQFTFSPRIFLPEEISMLKDFADAMMKLLNQFSPQQPSFFCCFKPRISYSWYKKVQPDAEQKRTAMIDAATKNLDFETACWVFFDLFVDIQQLKLTDEKEKAKFRDDLEKVLKQYSSFEILSEQLVLHLRRKSLRCFTETLLPDTDKHRGVTMRPRQPGAAQV